MGFSDRDAAVFKFLQSKIKGMTIFEYQKYILQDMILKMSISNTTVSELKNILYPLRNQIQNKMDGYTPTKITPEYNPQLGYTCSFKIESVKQNKDTFEGQAMLDLMSTIVLPLTQGKLSNKTFSSGPSESDIERIIRNLTTLKEKKSKGDDIVRTLGQIRFRSNKYDRNTDSIIGAYEIRFRYQSYKAIVQVIYISKETLRKEGKDDHTI